MFSMDGMPMTVWTAVAAVAAVWLLVSTLRFARADADRATLASPSPGPRAYADKVVLITGASSGIGEALAHQFARLGAKLVLSSRRLPELERVKSELPPRAGVGQDEWVRTARMDVGDLKAVPAAMEAAVAEFGRVDVLVNNAGISTRALAEECEMTVVEKVTRVDYLGQVAVTKGVLPGMLKRGSGHIINISSVAGKFGTTLRTAYCGAKFALIGYMDALRMETTHRGLTVTNVCPGPVNTPVSANALLADGSKFGRVLHGDGATSDKTIMPVARCARLIVNAATAKVPEVWITRQPVLVALYLAQYAPSLARWLLLRRAPNSIAAFRKSAAASS